MFLQACVRCRGRSFSFFLLVLCAPPFLCGGRSRVFMCLFACWRGRAIPAVFCSVAYTLRVPYRTLGFLLIFVSSEFTVAPRPAHVFLELCRGEGESYNFLLAFIDAWPFESCAL